MNQDLAWLILLIHYTYFKTNNKFSVGPDLFTKKQMMQLCSGNGKLPLSGQTSSSDHLSRVPSMDPALP